MKTFEHYCKTLHCKMSSEPCIGRQLLAVKAQTYRLNLRTLLLSQGFYPECYSCRRGRRLAASLGIDVPALRKQMIEMRRRIEESERIFYSLRSRSRSNRKRQL